MHGAPEETLEHRFRGEHPIRTLWFLFEGRRRDLAIAAALFSVKHSPVWALPLVTANLIDAVAGHRAPRELLLNVAVILAMVLQNLPVNIAFYRFLSRAVRGVENALRLSIAQRLQQVSMGFYVRTSAGVLQTKLVRDVEAIEQMLKTLADGGLTAINSLIGALVITAIKVPQFLPFFLLMVPIATFLVARLRGALATQNQRFREQIERMSARVAEMTTLLPITRAHGLEDEALHRIDSSFQDVRVAGSQLDMVNARFGAAAWVTFQLSNIACLGFACWAAYTQFLPISTGEIVMLTSYFGALNGSVLMLTSLIPTVTKGFASVRSIGEVLESPDVEANAGRRRVESVVGTIEFAGVSFRYPGVDVAALADVNLCAKPGSLIALVGPSGAGKSTLINLVIGFLRPTGGVIRIDGADMESLDLRTVRRFVSVVPQESVLFEGSIRDNIAYGMPAVDDARVRTALVEANAWEFVSALPHGLETLVGERGAKLSGGQRQRIAIARALIRNPRILILDEATSALDSESEGKIREATERLMRDRTTFVVAHRLSTIHSADQILVLDAGRVVQAGTYEALLAEPGLFRRLHEAQALTD